jgi:small ligand-binding sensory domain FIST
VPPDAASLALRAYSPAKVARELGALATRVARPSGGLVFVSGTLSAELRELAAALGESKLGFPWLIASGAGVLTERGEIEDQSAAAALVWSGGRARLALVDTPEPADFGETLCAALGELGAASGNRAVLLLARPEGFTPDLLAPLGSLGVAEAVFGAGTIGDPGVIVVFPDGTSGGGRGAALVIENLAVPIVRTASACRLVTPLYRVTEVQGAMVLGLNHRPALEVLAALGPELAGEQLVLAALVMGDPPSDPPRLDFLLRGIQGVDPDRQGVIVSGDIAPGMRLGFAVRDPAAARADLEAAVRELRQASAGAAPRFAVYLNCAARGSSLYGTYDVDTRILRQALPDTPLVGMQSSFEISPHRHQPALRLYSGVLGLFTAPS